MRSSNGRLPRGARAFEKKYAFGVSTDAASHQSVLVQFGKNTPKAFANLSPGFERRENPGFCNPTLN